MADEILNIKSWDPTGRSEQPPPPAPTPHAEWVFPGGKAWVYYANARFGLSRPVILSDGFHGGPTKLDEMYHGLERGAYPFITELNNRGRDLIILGYEDCTASILSNADVAQACIMKALSERKGSAPLVVGGFSMGGLITRYVLARMERQGLHHETDTYVCYDSPHHGAWMPISIQALAHSLGLQSELSKMVNSDASRQLLWRHIPDNNTEPREDPMREKFLDALAAVGGWPMRPRLIGVANGKGEGTNGIQAGTAAVAGQSGLVNGVKLFTQSAGEKVVVAQVGLGGIRAIKTSGLPAADGAHGGQLEGFGLAADKMGEAGQVSCTYRWHAFVPTGSAMATTGFDPFTDLGASVLNRESDLHDFKFASQNEKHTLMTRELGSWILERLGE